MKPVIVGCRTEDFTPEQLAVFKEHQPFGMTIFAEPCRKGPDTVRHVIAQFKSVCPDAKIFIDAEGGVVNRLKPSFGHGWRDVPGARSFARLALDNLDQAKAEIFENARLIAIDLVALGISVNCAPMVDLVSEEVIEKVGEDGKPHATSASLFRRSFGDDPFIVTECAKAFIAGLETQGVTAVVKHVPGYGRVSGDPHYEQTGIETPLQDLAKTDFVPFRNLNNARAMMTAHTIYTDIDTDYCSTMSPKVMAVIRDTIGFQGVIIADTIEMNAVWPQGFSTTEKDQFGMGLPLPGTLDFVTKRVLAAGCDLVMHSDCSRDFTHTVEILQAAPVLPPERAQWLHDTMTTPATETPQARPLA